MRDERNLKSVALFQFYSRSSLRTNQQSYSTALTTAFNSIVDLRVPRCRRRRNNNYRRRRLSILQQIFRQKRPPSTPPIRLVLRLSILQQIFSSTRCRVGDQEAQSGILSILQQIFFSDAVVVPSNFCKPFNSIVDLHFVDEFSQVSPLLLFQFYSRSSQNQQKLKRVRRREELTFNSIVDLLL